MEPNTPRSRTCLPSFEHMPAKMVFVASLPLSYAGPDRCCAKQPASAASRSNRTRSPDLRKGFFPSIYFCRAMSGRSSSCDRVVLLLLLVDASSSGGLQQEPGDPRCLIPRFDGAILSQDWKEALWDRVVTGAPRPRTPSEQQYSDRKLRSRS